MRKEWQLIGVFGLGVLFLMTLPANAAERIFGKAEKVKIGVIGAIQIPTGQGS